MAKLNAYYGLCPLVDYKNFIGVAKDIEHGQIIVTQSKNIAIKYRLSDQKQIQSWRTRDRITSPVIYDKEKGRYIGVFNQTILRTWASEDIENLDKIKKHTIPKPIYTLISVNDNIFVIFENGCILTLQTTLEQRKSLHFEDVIDIKNEHIVDVKYISVDNIVYIALITNTKSTVNCLLTSFPINFPQSSYHKIELKRQDINLSGHSLCLIHNKYLYFLTLWDDNQMFAYLVASPTNQEVDTNYTESFGTLFCHMESISCKQNVAMVPIASDHIALYGADCNQEGACVIIYNTRFKVTQSKQTFKMFSNITKIWNIDNILLLCSGQHLAVIPFEVNTEQLSELVGSHKIDVTDTDVQQTYAVEKWDIEESNDYSTFIPSNIRESVLNCVGQGLSETVTCDTLIPTYIENSDGKAIESCVNYFKDIPEECLAKIVVYVIENRLSYDDEQIPNRDDLIDKVLSIPFTNVLMLPHIKGVFNINITLAVLKYISLVFSSEACLPGLSFVQTERKLIDWACVLLDGNYQKFLLSRDNIVHETLKNFNILVNEHLLGLDDLQCVEPVITDFLKGKCLNGKEQSNMNYCIEDVKLY